MSTLDSYSLQYNRQKYYSNNKINFIIENVKFVVGIQYNKSTFFSTSYSICKLKISQSQSLAFYV